MLPESAAYVAACHDCSGGASACPQEIVVTAPVHCERIDNSVTTARTSPHFRVDRHIKSYGARVSPAAGSFPSPDTVMLVHTCCPGRDCTPQWAFVSRQTVGLHRRRSIALGDTGEVSRMHPLGRQIRRPCVFRSIVEPFPGACASAPSSDVAVFAQLLQCCTSASAADHRPCHHLQVVNPVPCRCQQSRWGRRAGRPACCRTELPWALCLSGAVCCASITWPTLRAAAHPVTPACTVVAEPSFTKVGSRG